MREGKSGHAGGYEWTCGRVRVDMREGTSGRFDSGHLKVITSIYEENIRIIFRIGD